MKKVLFLASGSGSNVMAILQHLRDEAIEYRLITNNAKAGIIEKIKQFSSIETAVFSNEHFSTSSAELIDAVNGFSPDLIVLAGFLRKFPNELINKYEGSIINIHPSLLPKYGGKGMYGIHVHRAVLEAGEKESGMTIHEVTSEYDKGRVILQCSVDITACTTSEDIATAVLKLEHANFYKAVRIKLGL